jgi:hypothetical protein
MRGGRKHKHCGTCEELDRRGREQLAEARDHAHREAVEAAPEEYLNAVTWRTGDSSHSWLDYADIEGVRTPNYDCGDTCEMCVPDWRERRELQRKLEREKPTFTFAERVLAQVGIGITLLRTSS